MSLYPRLFQNRLNENPDSVYLPEGDELTWEDENAFAFGYYKGNMYMSPKSGGHGSMGPEKERESKFFNRDDFKFAGRIWKPEKIISFWTYPDKKEFYKLLSDISNITDINFNSSWRVELNDGKLISIEDYKESGERSEKDLAKQHVMSPMLKPKRKVELGWGSNSDRYKKKREWAMADMAHESFYPRINEAGQYTKGAGNTFLLRELSNKYPKKYKYSTGVRIENIAKTPVDEFKKDFLEVADEFNVPVVKSTVRFAYPGQPGAVSGKFPGLRFELDGKDYGVKYSGVSAGGQMTQTPAVFKEGLVVYFFQTKLTYDPFNKATKDKTQNYLDVIDKMVLDIKQNSIKGMDQKDVDYIIRTLETEGKEWNVLFAGSIFNAMSIGNRLKKTQFKDWEIYRDKFFNDIKKEAAKALGFAANAVDKWNPMDIILVKPGCKQQILDKWAEAKTKETEELKLGDYNNIFADSLDTENQNSIALAISLKEQTSQGGKGKSYISKHEKVSDRYNLTKEEQSWSIEKFMKEIEKQREKTTELIDKLKETDIYHYAPEQPINGFAMPEAAKAKYGSLKMLNYLLEKVPEDNMFISLAAYSLSLGMNPTFFKFQGTRDGSPDKVHIYKFPQKGGVSLYNKAYENYDGKILIRDGNNNTGIEVRYFIATAKILYSVVLQIRVNQGTLRVDKGIQVTIEVQKISEIEDLTEAQIMAFYPRLFEAFSEDTDPIKDMGIGIIKIINADLIIDAKLNEIRHLQPQTLISILNWPNEYNNYNIIFNSKTSSYSLDELYGRTVMYKNKIYKITK